MVGWREVVWLNERICVVEEVGGMGFGVVRRRCRWKSRCAAGVVGGKGGRCGFGSEERVMEAVLDGRVILCGWTLKRCLHGERAWSIRGGDWWVTVES